MGFVVFCGGNLSEFYSRRSWHNMAKTAEGKANLAEHEVACMTFTPELVHCPINDHGLDTQDGRGSGQEPKKA